MLQTFRTEHEATTNNPCTVRIQCKMIFLVQDLYFISLYSNYITPKVESKKKKKNSKIYIWVTHTLVLLQPKFFIVCTSYEVTKCPCTYTYVC